MKLYDQTMPKQVELADVLEGLASRWSQHPLLPVCMKIAQYVGGIGVTNAKFLTLHRLSKVVGKQEVDEELLSALNILLVSTPPLLNVAATLHYGDEEFDLDPEEIDAILGDDSVVHPDTGEMIFSASKFTEIYYTVSEDLTESA